MKVTFNRVTICILAAVGIGWMTVHCPTVEAGFVSDFVEDIQSNSNVTQAGIKEAGALNVVTGGGFVYKTPRKDFVPFSVTPPSLKAGCGGIDLFLGAFSIPSKDEFVSFLKSVERRYRDLPFNWRCKPWRPT